MEPWPAPLAIREDLARLGTLIKAVRPNDGAALPYEEGTPVTLHLPAEAIRVLATAPPS
jgi:hypothetical protein